MSGNKVVVLMAVANETSSTIVLPNSRGRIVGFEANPMPTVRLTSGVLVKIPVVIRRVERRDADGNVVDIAAVGAAWVGKALSGNASLRTLDVAANGLNDAAKAQLSKLAEARSMGLQLML